MTAFLKNRSVSENLEVRKSNCLKMTSLCVYSSLELQRKIAEYYVNNHCSFKFPVFFAVSSQFSFVTYHERKILKNNILKVPTVY